MEDEELPPEPEDELEEEEEDTSQQQPQAQPTAQPAQKRPKHPIAAAYPRTDLGNADYFIDLFGNSIRFDQSRRRWLIWREHRWEPDELKRAEQAAQSAARHRLIEAIRMPRGNGRDSQGNMDPATKTRDDAMKWATLSEGRFRIESVLVLAQKTSRISVQTSRGWDADQWSLGVPNGVVDLKTGKLRAGSRDDHITKHAGVKYDPSAKCPRWELFLKEILSNDEELVTFVRRALGYTITGDLREDCWFGCYGTGSNGKSTLFEMLHTVFGDYGYVAPFSLVQRGRGEARRDFDIAYLQNMRFVMASETSEGGVWDEERLKRLSGGDPLHAEIKHGAEFEFLPSHKLWFMFNHQPRVRDHSVGFWRRVRLIPFSKNYDGVDIAEKDNLLAEKLTLELPGILTWIVKAVREWLDHGLPVPLAVRAASTRYETDEDPLSEFIACHMRTSGPGFPLASAYSLYKDWCKIENVDHPLGKNRFGALLEPRGFKRSSRKDIALFENGQLIKMCTCMKKPCVC